MRQRRRTSGAACVLLGALLAGAAGCSQRLSEFDTFPCAKELTCPRGYYCSVDTCLPRQDAFVAGALDLSGPAGGGGQRDLSAGGPGEPGFDLSAPRDLSSRADLALPLGFDATLRLRLDGNTTDSVSGVSAPKIGTTAAEDRNGVSGGALAFASGDYIDLQTFAAAHPQPPFTVSVWFNFTAGCGTINPRFFENAAFYFGLWGTGATRQLSFGVQPFMEKQSTTTVGAGAWHMASVTVSSTAGGVLYLDGAEVARFTGMPMSFSYASLLAQVGRKPTPANDAFCGALDDFRIYDRELSSAELTLLVAGLF